MSNDTATPIGPVVSTAAAAAAEAVVADGLGPGLQVYASVNGRPVADFAIGDARDGVPMRPDSIVPWLSATKPILATVFARLHASGKVDFDNYVTRFVPAFAKGGKGDARLSDLLSHRVPYAGDIRLGAAFFGWDVAVGEACALELASHGDVGRVARYTSFASWQVLGEIAQQLLDEPLGPYVRRTIFEPLGMNRCWLGAPANEAAAIAGDQCEMTDRLDRGRGLLSLLNAELYRTATVPGVGGLGPINELARLYEAIAVPAGPARAALGIAPRSLELVTTTARSGLRDPFYGAAVDWGLGFMTDRRFFGGARVSPRVFGHDGRRSSLAFADRETGLVVAVLANSLTEPRANSRRLRRIVDALLDDAGFRRIGAQRAMQMRAFAS